MSRRTSGIKGGRATEVPDYRIEAWGDWKKGDVVRITGKKSCRYTIHYFDAPDDKPVLVTVWGGTYRDGHYSRTAWRTFAAERIREVK